MTTNSRAVSLLDENIQILSIAACREKKVLQAFQKIFMWDGEARRALSDLLDN